MTGHNSGAGRDPVMAERISGIWITSIIQNIWERWQPGKVPGRMNRFTYFYLAFRVLKGVRPILSIIDRNRGSSRRISKSGLVAIRLKYSYSLVLAYIFLSSQ